MSITEDEIRKEIKKHLNISYKIHPVVNKILKRKTVDIETVARNHNIFDLQDNLKLNVDILKRKRSYKRSKINLNEAVIDVMNNIDESDVVEKYDIDVNVLREEVNKRLEIGKSYEYDIYPSNNKDEQIFTFIEEASLLDEFLSYWKRFKSICKCQACALTHLVTYAYNFANNKKPTKCPDTWHDLKRADLKWIYEFEMRYHNKISKLKTANNCEIDFGASSSSFAQSSSIEKRSDIKENIRKHINISKRLEMAAEQIIQSNKNIINVASEFDLGLWICYRKVQILQWKRDYSSLQFKFNEAVNKVSEQPDNLSDIATSYGIDEDKLKKEYTKYSQIRANPYQYDRSIIPYGVFTSAEDRVLLDSLTSWTKNGCSCKVCKLLCLQEKALEYAIRLKREYPLQWKTNEKADEIWLYDFEMKHTAEINKSANKSPCMHESAIEVTQETSKTLNKQDTSEPSPSEPSTSKPSISSVYVQKDYEPEQYINPAEMEDLSIRLKIERHLPLSKKLDKAAKKVINQNEDIVSIAQYYELDSWLLHQKVYISKLTNTHFEKRTKLENSVNNIIYNKISVSDAAAKYKVNEYTVAWQLKKWQNSESGVYVYEAHTIDNGVFTFPEEFQLMKKLQKNVTKTEECKCQKCALTYLSTLAYQYAKKHNKIYPSIWNINKKADIIWLLKFEMRHSIEISNAFTDKCLMEEMLANIDE